MAEFFHELLLDFLLGFFKNCLLELSSGIAPYNPFHTFHEFFLGNSSEISSEITPVDPSFIVFFKTFLRFLKNSLKNVRSYSKSILMKNPRRNILRNHRRVPWRIWKETLWEIPKERFEGISESQNVSWKYSWRNSRRKSTKKSSNIP